MQCSYNAPGVEKCHREATYKIEFVYHVIESIPSLTKYTCDEHTEIWRSHKNRCGCNTSITPLNKHTCTILMPGDRPCNQPASTQTKVDKTEYLCDYHTTLFETLIPITAGQEQRKCSKVMDGGFYCATPAIAVTKYTNEPYCLQHIPSYTDVIML